VTAPGPLDDRARWLLATLRLLYDELDPDAQPIALSIVVLSGSQIVTYGIDPGSDGITRLVTDVSNLDVIASAIRDGALSDVVTDATVRDSPP